MLAFVWGGHDVGADQCQGVSWRARLTCAAAVRVRCRSKSIMHGPWPIWRAVFGISSCIQYQHPFGCPILVGVWAGLITAVLLICGVTLLQTSLGSRITGARS